jgi:hypothetical protein
LAREACDILRNADLGWLSGRRKFGGNTWFRGAFPPVFPLLT